MTNDKRLEHLTPARRRGGAQPGANNYKAEEERAEELQTISPVFRRLQKQKLAKPAPDQWRKFSQDLHRKLETQNAPYTQTLRDRISASDSVMLHWFWIIMALLALLVIGAAIGLALNDSTQTAIASLPAYTSQIRIL